MMAQLPAQVRRQKGLALPAQQSPGGYFQAKGELDVAWGDLMLALFTPIGTRPYNRTFGSSLYQMIYEPNIKQNTVMIDYVIRDTASRWVPSIEIIDVVLRDVKPTSLLNRDVGIEIAFRLAGSDEVFNRLARIPRDDARQSTKVSTP